MSMWKTLEIKSQTRILMMTKQIFEKRLGRLCIDNLL